MNDDLIVLDSPTDQIKPQQVSDGRQGTFRVSHCILTTRTAQVEEEFELMEEEDIVKINKKAFTMTAIMFLPFTLHYSWNRLLLCLDMLKNPIQFKTGKVTVTEHIT